MNFKVGDRVKLKDGVTDTAVNPNREELTITRLHVGNSDYFSADSTDFQGNKNTYAHKLENYELVQSAKQGHPMGPRLSKALDKALAERESTEPKEDIVDLWRKAWKN